jgi:hypothetical protein
MKIIIDGKSLCEEVNIRRGRNKKIDNKLKTDNTISIKDINK